MEIIEKIGRGGCHKCTHISVVIKMWIGNACIDLVYACLLVMAVPEQWDHNNHNGNAHIDILYIVKSPLKKPWFYYFFLLIILLQSYMILRNTVHSSIRPSLSVLKMADHPSILFTSLYILFYLPWEWPVTPYTVYFSICLFLSDLRMADHSRILFTFL